ncbi:hypothetical protein JCM3766R1_006236 [Sporobolomyces carnicolor]
MSLYGGIKLTGSKLPTASTATPAAATPAEGKPNAPPADQDKPRPANWSAALRFAPTQRKKPSAASTARPLSNAFSANLDEDDDTPAQPPANAIGVPRMAKVGKASLNVEPIKRPPPSKWGAGSSMAAQEAILLEAKAKAAAAAAAQGASTSTNQSSSTASAPRRTGAALRVRRIIPIPPSMTLEDETILPTASAAGTDVNGFAATAMGQKLAKEQERKNNKRGKKRKGHGGGGGEDPALRYGDIPYDPARPCDYAGYKTHVKLMRAQRRLEREEEERQRRRREGSQSGSSYYSEDDEDEHDDRREEPTKRARFFAPPTSYDDERPSGFLPPTDSTTAAYTPAPSFAAPSREETADEAYARRVALSNPGAPNREETGDEAYQRRLALSQRPQQSFAPDREEPVVRRGLGGGASSSTSAPAPPSFITSSFVPPTSFVPSTSFVAPTTAPSSLPPSLPPPPPGFVPPPSFVGHAAPPPPPPTEPITPAPAPPVSAARSDAAPSAVDAAAARAREIAARLSKLGGAFSAGPPLAPPAALSPSAPAFRPSQASAPEPAEPDHRPFAERMMSKYGWTSGKGLGAAESGMTTALSVSRPSSTTPKLSRAQKKKQKHFGLEVAEAPQGGAAVGMAARNNVVDSSRQGRAQEREKEMGGEPSRVVLLENICGADEVDDELPGEIAEEANKLGVVERCAVVVVPVEEDEAAGGDREEVRVFLVMSGLAGAYNAVRSFEGRFFGGRTVRARYYNEDSFKAGEHHL